MRAFARWMVPVLLFAPLAARAQDASEPVAREIAALSQQLRRGVERYVRSDLDDAGYPAELTTWVATPAGGLRPEPSLVLSAFQQNRF